MPLPTTGISERYRSSRRRIAFRSSSSRSSTCARSDSVSGRGARNSESPADCVRVMSRASTQRGNTDDDHLDVVRPIAADPAAVTERIVVVIRDQNPLAVQHLEALDGLQREGERIADPEFAGPCRKRDPIGIRDIQQVEDEAFLEEAVRTNPPQVDEIDLLLLRLNALEVIALDQDEAVLVQCGKVADQRVREPRVDVVLPFPG